MKIKFSNYAFVSFSTEKEDECPLSKKGMVINMIDENAKGVLMELLYEIECGSREELLALAISKIGSGGRIFTPNITMLADAVRDEHFAALLRTGLMLPDGVGVGRMLSRLGRHTDVYPGVELLPDMLSRRPSSVALIGAEEGIAEAAGEYLKKISPKSNIVFCLSGYNIEPSKLRTRLDITRPELIAVCIGSPRQERLISELYSAYPSGVYIGLGGSLDIYSGKKQRAPKLLRQMGLEWLYRMVREPRRLSHIPQMLGTYTSFYRLLGEKTGKKPLFRQKNNKKPNKN